MDYPLQITRLPARPSPQIQISYSGSEFARYLFEIPGECIERALYYDNTCIMDPRDIEFWKQYENGATIVYSLELIFYSGNMITFQSLESYLPHHGAPGSKKIYNGLFGSNYSILESNEYLVVGEDVGSVWDVTHLWWPLVGNPITAVEVYRSGAQDTAQAVLHFLDGNTLYIVPHVASLDGPKIVKPGDDLLVLFSEQLAAEMKLGRHSGLMRV